MRATVRFWVLTALGFSLLAGGVLAAAAAPGPVLTRPLPGTRCSVSAGLSISDGTGRLGYRGAVSCAGGAGAKTLDVVPQVYRAGPRRRWVALSLVGRYQGPTPVNPLRLSAATTTAVGHLYRVLVYGRVTRADGRTSSLTVCAGCAGAPLSGPAPALSIRPRSRFPAGPATSARLRGTPCSVTQDGLEFALVNGTYVLSYRGFAACRGAPRPARPSLRICAQVARFRHGRSLWSTIAGSCLSGRADASGVVAVSAARTAFLGHGYRVVATARVRYPTARGVIVASATTLSPSAAP